MARHAAFRDRNYVMAKTIVKMVPMKKQLAQQTVVLLWDVNTNAKPH